MSGTRCCVCHKKATLFRHGKLYCDDCVPKKTRVKEVELDMAHPDWEPKKTKKSFWEKWFEHLRFGGLY